MYTGWTSVASQKRRILSAPVCVPALAIAPWMSAVSAMLKFTAGASGSGGLVTVIVESSAPAASGRPPANTRA